MMLTFDCDRGLLTNSSSMLSPLQAIEAKRGDGEHIKLQLLKGGALWQAPGTAQFRFVVKPVGEYPAEAYALADSFVFDSGSTSYEAAINYVTEALDELLNIETDPENQKTTVLMCELAWRPTSSVSWRRSQEVPFTLWNNVWRGTETVPGGSPTEPGGGPYLVPAVVSISSNVVNSNATANTLADITGLSFPVENGKRYAFEFLIPYTAAATTTGARFTINGPTAANLSFVSRWPLTGTTESVNYHSAYNLPSAAGATSLAAGNVAVIKGMITAGADGDVVARFASEVSGSAVTVLAGACVTFTELGV